MNEETLKLLSALAEALEEIVNDVQSPRTIQVDMVNVSSSSSSSSSIVSSASSVDGSAEELHYKMRQSLGQLGRVSTVTEGGSSSEVDRFLMMMLRVVNDQLRGKVADLRSSLRERNQLPRSSAIHGDAKALFTPPAVQNVNPTVAKLQADLKEKEAACNDMAEELAVMDERRCRMENEVKVLHALLSESKAELAETLSDRSSAQTALQRERECSQRAQTLEQEVTSERLKCQLLQDEIEDKNLALTLLKRSLESKTKEVGTLAQQRDEAREKLRIALSDVQDLQVKQDKLKQDNQRLQSSTMNLEEDIKEMKHRQERFVKRFRTDQNGDVDLLVLDRTFEENEKLTAQVGDLETELDQMKATTQREIDLRLEKESDLSRLEESTKQLKSTLEHEEECKKNLESRLAVALERLDRVQKAYMDLQKDEAVKRKSLERELVRLKADIAYLEARLITEAEARKKVEPPSAYCPLASCCQQSKPRKSIRRPTKQMTTSTVL